MVNISLFTSISHQKLIIPNQEEAGIQFTRISITGEDSRYIHTSRSLCTNLKAVMTHVRRDFLSLFLGHACARSTIPAIPSIMSWLDISVLFMNLRHHGNHFLSHPITKCGIKLSCKERMSFNGETGSLSARSARIIGASSLFGSPYRVEFRLRRDFFYRSQGYFAL